MDTRAFKDYFKSQIEYRNDFGMVMRFNNARVNKQIKRFVFVEGSTDRRFYSNTSDNRLCKDTEYFFKKVSENDVVEYAGKEAVFYSYKVINNDDVLRTELPKCIFIIDRDYSEQIQSKSFPMTSGDYDFFSVTKGHSFENYFIEDRNISEVFKYYNLTDKDLDEFKSRFKQFFLSAYEYFALLGVISEMYEETEQKYRKKYSKDDIVLLSFKDGRMVDIDKMNEEKRRMRAYIRENGKKEFSKQIVERASKSPIYMRGHNVFEYIQKYLLFYFNIKLDDSDNYSDYRRVVKKLFVEI